jgi:hypothetical protein
MAFRQQGVWRLIALVPIAITGLMSIVATNGGGGLIEEIAEQEPTLLPSYAYSISALPGLLNPLLVTLETDGDPAVISIDLGNTVTGTVETELDANDNLVFPARTVAAGSSMGVAVSVDPFGSFDIDVVTDLDVVLEDPPSAGEIEIISASETSVVTFVATGVELGLSGTVPVFFTWDDFGALLENDTVPDWQRRASLGVLALEYVYIRAFAVIGVLGQIDDRLVSANPRIVMCAAFTGSPPPGVLAQGLSTLTWLGSGSLQPGQDFRWEFTDCRIDDPSTDRDELLNGGIDLLGYSRVVSNNVLTRIGFEPTQTGDGGVVFDDFVIQPLAQDSFGNFVFDGGRERLGGGFVVVLSAP